MNQNKSRIKEALNHGCLTENKHGEALDTSDADTTDPPVLIGEMLPQIIQRIGGYEAAGGIIGIPTGFTVLDTMTGGFQGGDLIIIGGHPSMGKTSLCMSMALNAATKAKCPTAFFSLEATDERTCEQILCMEAKIDLRILQGNMLPKRDYPKLERAADILKKAPLYLSGSAGIPLKDIEDKIRYFKAHNNIKFVLIDYLQLIDINTEKETIPDIPQIIRSLKKLALELDIPIIVVSQLLRENKQRVDHRPRLFDLPGDGYIEQIADIVIFVYRDELYNKNEDNKGEIELIVAKHRNGPVGTMEAAFFRDYRRVADISEMANMPGYSDDSYITILNKKNNK